MSSFDSRLSWLPAFGCLYLPVYFCTRLCDAACLLRACHGVRVCQSLSLPAHHLACIELPASGRRWGGGRDYINVDPLGHDHTEQVSWVRRCVRTSRSGASVGGGELRWALVELVVCGA
jgi:hypothetical protein